MKYFLLVFSFIVSTVIYSQSYVMSNASATTCSGLFYDSGGSGGTYSASQSFTKTFCPATPGSKMSFNFTAFNLESNFDFLYIYDGNSTVAPSLGVYTGTLVPGLVNATATNTSGCLTFVFKSDASVQYNGWDATISCLIPCQTINVVLNNSTPTPVNGIIKTCLGQTTTFNGGATFSGSGVGATYVWDFGNGATATGSNVAYTYTSVGSYFVNLKVTDPSGCSNSNSIDILAQVGTKPHYTVTTSTDTICLGQTATISASATSVSFNGACPLPLAGVTFLPDGSGVSYSTAINVNCFLPSQTLNSITDLQNICINMEHSYLGDLQIEIICPNGQAATLLSYPSNASSANLGIPWATSTTDGSSSTITPGTGANYCFSMSGSTTLGGGILTGGTFPNGNGPATYIDSYVPAGTYSPSTSFSGLVGCPLNGNWTIKVTDNLAIDNGYVFGWNLDFIPAVYINDLSYTPTITTQSWTPNPTIISSVGQTITVKPTTLGQTCYTYSVMDNFGCNHDTLVCIQVNPGAPISVNSASLCPGESFTIVPSGLLTYTFSSGTSVVTPSVTTVYTVTGTDGVGCNNIAVSTVTVSPSPIISVPSTTICPGSTGTVVASGAATYTWSNGASTASISDNPSVTSVYTVSGTSASGCLSLPYTTTITIGSAPSIAVNNSSICAGNSATLTANGVTSYTWSTGENTNSIVVTPTINTTYTVNGNLIGCSMSASNISTVTINTLPSVSVNSGAICSGNSFTMQPSGALTYSYSGGNDVVSPIVNTTYTVTGIDANGCENMSISSVTVNALPLVTVNSGSLCIGSSFTLVPSGASTYTYSTGNNIVTPLSNSNYTVTGTDLNGCENFAVSNITVNSLPSITESGGVICAGQIFTLNPLGALTYSISGGTATISPTMTTSYSITGTDAFGCTNNNAVITTVTVNPLPIISVNSGTICNGESFIIIPTGALTYTYSSGTNSVMPLANTSYSVNGTDVNGCVSSTSAVSNITVMTLPIIVATTSNSLLCISQTATLSATGATSYTWSTNENTPDIAITPTIQTTFTVVGADINGCTSSTTITQDIDLCTSVSQLSLATSINSYPNPFNEVFYIELIEQTDITIVNALSQLVYQSSLDNGTHQINLSAFASGLYILKATSAKNSSVKYLVKE